MAVNTDSEKHEAVIGTYRNCPRIKFYTRWTGQRASRPEEDFTSVFKDTKSPYLNLHVLHFYDVCRAYYIYFSLACALVTYHLRNSFDLPFACGPTDITCFWGSQSGTEATPSIAWTAWSTLAAWSEIFQWFEILNLFILVLAFKRGTDGIVLRLFAWLHYKVKRGQVEFVPVECRAYLAQQIWLTATSSVTVLVINLSSSYTTAIDRKVVSYTWPLVLAHYLVLQASRSNCGTRTFSAAFSAAGLVNTPPQEWNGLKMKEMSYSNGGPNFHFTEDGQFIVDPRVNVDFAFDDEFKNATMLQLFTNWIWVNSGRLQVMLLFWHSSVGAWTLYGLVLGIAIVFMNIYCVLGAYSMKKAKKLTDARVAADDAARGSADKAAEDADGGKIFYV